MKIQIITLGTGSGKPTFKRNVSSTALVYEGHMVLFDAGEGTQMQVQSAQLKLSKLRAICISHMHGDHLNGLPGILGSLSLAHHELPLTVIGPPGIRHYLSVLKKYHVFYPSYELQVVEINDEGGRVFEHEQFEIWAKPIKHRVPCFGYRWIEKDKPGRFDLEAARALGIPVGPLYGILRRGESIQLQDGRIIHPHQVLGEARKGKVIAYCTDTAPCDACRALAQHANLLIHEGTYGPEFEDQARQRGHSTVVQAARIAKDAEAQKLLLIHFSPKYDDFRVLLKAAREVFEETRLAKDLEVYEI